MSELLYHSQEGFSLLHVDSFWYWQETGAEGWSCSFTSKQEACDDIDSEFGVMHLNLYEGNNNGG